jgi:formylmethanofuran dehydrogenase subunit D
MAMDVVLNTGSTVYEGKVIKGGGKFTDDYTRECSYCEINPEDFVTLGKPWFVRVSNSLGDSVVLRARKSRTQQKGEIWIVRGVWANVIVLPETQSTGSPAYKNWPAKIEKCDGPVLGPVELMQQEYCKGNKEKAWQN